MDALDTRRQNHFDLEDTRSTVLDYVSEWIANGQTLKALAQDLSTELGFDLWAESLNRMLRRTFGEQAVDRALAEARMRASHGFAEESVEIVDQADDTSSAAVSKASSRARSRQWLASKWNRKDYGDEKGVSVNVSITSLHLDALRAQTPKVTGAVSMVAQAIEGTRSEDRQPIAITEVSGQ